MIADELRDARAPGRIHTQPRQDRIRKLRAFGGVTVKVSDAVIGKRKARRLSDIVQQRCPAQHRLGRDVLHDRDRVLPDVPVVVRVVLRKTEHRPQLRYGDGQHIGKFPQHRACILPAEQLCQLAQHALHRKIPQQLGAAVDGRRRLRLDGKAEHGRKAQRTQNAQPVLPKAALGLTHAAHDAARKILRTAADIHKPRLRVVSQRVHRKIAPQQIGAQAARKRHAVRSPVI